MLLGGGLHLSQDAGKLLALLLSAQVRPQLPLAHLRATTRARLREACGAPVPGPSVAHPRQGKQRSPPHAARAADSRMGAARTLRARLSLPTLSNSITRLSYGAHPATSRTIARTCAHVARPSARQGRGNRRGKLAVRGGPSRACPVPRANGAPASRPQRRVISTLQSSNGTRAWRWDPRCAERRGRECALSRDAGAPQDAARGGPGRVHLLHTL